MFSQLLFGQVGGISEENSPMLLCQIIDQASDLRGPDSKACRDNSRRTVNCCFPSGCVKLSGSSWPLNTLIKCVERLGAVVFEP